MNRRSFLKSLSIGVATAAVAPKMLAEDHYPGMSGTPINIQPYRPIPSVCGNIYPTYADYSRSVTIAQHLDTMDKIQANMAKRIKCHIGRK